MGDKPVEDLAAAGAFVQRRRAQRQLARRQILALPRHGKNSPLMYLTKLGTSRMHAVNRLIANRANFVKLL